MQRTGENGIFKTEGSEQAFTIYQQSATKTDVTPFGISLSTWGAFNYGQTFYFNLDPTLSWSARSNDAHITFKAGTLTSGAAGKKASLAVVVAPNTTKKQRWGSITLTAGYEKMEIKFVQNP